MQTNPLAYQAVRAQRQRSRDNFRSSNLDQCFMTPVDGVKMWRWMIGPKHPNNDAVKAAEFRHVAVHGED
ncbi:MAG: hypothetical protein QOG23_1465 [Blastocatellia bacterium]|nr:hypothetical protein [Blastocatellia bacterium]